MPETPELHERVAKLQKDVEELRAAMEDSWHHRREEYESRVRRALENDPNSITLYLEIDDNRSINEIEQSLVAGGRTIPHTSLWMAIQRLRRAGLIRKVGIKGPSPIYAKQPWAKALDMDSYVRVKILKEGKPVQG